MTPQIPPLGENETRKRRDSKSSRDESAPIARVVSRVDKTGCRAEIYAAERDFPGAEREESHRLAGVWRRLPDPSWRTPKQAEFCHTI